jgi:SpoVK/Ycf46/Vps4 family AAA+-type ATPase
MSFLTGDLLKIQLLSHLKTNNPFIDIILSVLFFILLSYFSEPFIVQRLFNISWTDLLNNCINIFNRKCSVSFEGKHSFTINKFDSIPCISVCFTDSFKALLFDIISNISKNKNIYEIKEYITSKNYKNAIEDMYIVTQHSSFLYNKELNIFAKIENYAQEKDGDNKNGTFETNTIIITLYSYKTDIRGIQSFVENIKNNYLKHIENMRFNEKFIYSLIKTSHENCRYECWKECKFESAKTFDNIFFDGKDDVLKNIRFFLENKDWYYANGIPYTLGIGLSGEPGTGKTSFFKALANMTGRHLVVLSLKLIKTKNQLETFFNEDKYNENNKDKGIGFDKKIIIFEDIDCVGDIVIDRKIVEKKKNEKKNKKSSIVEQLIDYNEEISQPFNTIHQDELLTLDDLLNIFDGLHETPGRIMGITSNFYEKLDPALIRPGRIDITLKMGNASLETICNMYHHFYGKSIQKNKMKMIKDKYFSAAEIINFYIHHKDEPELFLQKLMKK